MIKKILKKTWYSKIGILSILLSPVALIFLITIKIKYFLYYRSILKKKNFKIPIVIIGNVTVGGSGKTPFCIWLANHLTKKGLTIGIVSSGYRGSSNSPQVVTHNSNPDIVGDEAYMLHKLTSSIVVSGGNRIEATQLLVESDNFDLILHDDGLQHYALARNYEILMIDSIHLYGNKMLLPSGPLREPLNLAKKRANIEIVTNLNDIKKFENNSLSQYHIITHNKEVENTANKIVKPIDSFANNKVHLVTGIAHNDLILLSLLKYNIDVYIHEYDDHHKFTSNDLKFNDSCPIFITMKDYVKLSKVNNKNLWVLKHEIKPSEMLINKIDDDINRLVCYEN